MGQGAKYIGLHLRYIILVTDIHTECAGGKEWYFRFNVPRLDLIDTSLSLLCCLRNGQDWVRACDHVTRPGVTALFSSPQCLGYRGERGQLEERLCRPGADTVIRQLGEAIR